LFVKNVAFFSGKQRKEERNGRKAEKKELVP